MSHYFNKDIDKEVKSQEFIYQVKFKDTTFSFVSDNGVFSKDFLDIGTKILLDNLDIKEKSHILDMGCGIGVIGIILTKLLGVTADLVDVNDRALRLSNINALRNHVDVSVFESDFFQNISSKYDYIISNPPIHVGKEALHSFYENSVNYLHNDGELWLVINKKHGALTTIKKLEEIYGFVEVVNKKTGFYVIKAKKCLTN